MTHSEPHNSTERPQPLHPSNGTTERERDGLCSDDGDVGGEGGREGVRATCVKEVASCAAAVDLIANSRRSDERAKGRTNSVSDFVLGNADVTGKTFMTV